MAGKPIVDVRICIICPHRIRTSLLYEELAQWHV
jgi:hypothetical protein